MKNKKLIISLAAVALILVVVLVICLSGNKLEKYTKKINNSVLSSSKVTSTISLTDNDVLVYRCEKLYTIVDEKNATVVITTDALNNEFELKQSKTSEIIDDLKTSDLFNLTLDKELFKSYELKDNNLTAEITSENVSKVLNQDVKVKDNATLVITFDANKIKKIECTYQTPSLKDVVISIVYEY